MLGIEFGFPTAKLRKELAFNHHVFVGSSSDPCTIRLLPPLSITQADADLLLEKLALAISEIAPILV
jgi:acetylornithine aminotransferase